MEEIVLVNEHDESILDVLKIALELENFIVVPVLSCDDRILEMINQHRPHVVMLDVKLNASDCTDLCKQIKDTYPHLPVIALSCNANIDVQYAQEGFDAYIKKPFDLDFLYRLIRQHLPASSRNLN